MGMQVGGGQGSGDLQSDINVTPFVDVMLVLLVIFMVTAPMMATGVDIALPETKAAQIEDAEGKLVLSIDLNHHLFLGATPVPWSDLQEMLEKNHRVQTEKALHIEGHKDLPYGVVVTAMAVAKEAGVEKVMMLTDPGARLDLSSLDAHAAQTPLPGGDGP
jgi:biopolymer transport protein TolR